MSDKPLADTPASSPAPDDFHALAAGTRIGRYEFLKVLGQGGFGITYQAHDSALQREVAIKEYLPGGFSIRRPDGTVLARSTQTAEIFLWGRERFIDEARTLARLERATGIVNVHDIVETNGTAYMVMEFVRGGTLEARLSREGTLRQAAIDQFLGPLLHGLEQVHAAGFLHRDIKPANILLDEQDRPTLIDFGASRMALQGRTRALTVVYTPGYAAFEQSTSAKQGPWTDIYAVGATLYHCIAGAPPPYASDRMIDDTLAPAVEIGKGRYALDLLAAIDASLKLRPADRPQSIAEWRRVRAGPAASIPTVRALPEARWNVSPSEPSAAAKDANTGASKGNEVQAPLPHRHDPVADLHMVRVPPGSFLMGSPSDEAGRFNTEGPQHRVTISHPFWLGRYMVTRRAFAAFVEATGHPVDARWHDPTYTKAGNDPAQHVSWRDATEYVRWLSRTTGTVYRLASEAEWEYAARAGSSGARYWGDGNHDDDAHANMNDNETGPVGRYPPNPFGLYDMLGNGWEWAEDCWNETYDGAPTDGTSWTHGDCTHRVLRGGSWSNKPGALRAASRISRDAGYRDNRFGFRIAHDD